VIGEPSDAFKRKLIEDPSGALVFPQTSNRVRPTKRVRMPVMDPLTTALEPRDSSAAGGAGRLTGGAASGDPSLAMNTIATTAKTANAIGPRHVGAPHVGARTAGLDRTATGGRYAPPVLVVEPRDRRSWTARRSRSQG